MVLGRAAGFVLRLVLALAIGLVALWGALALWYRLPAPEAARYGAAGLFALFGLITIAALFSRFRTLALVLFVAVFVGLILWWRTILPPAQGDWAPDVARQVTGIVADNKLTLTNLRDFEWRSDADFTERWATRTYDLSKLRTVDLFMSYWAGPEMAHTILSFGFEGGQYLAWSIEVRRLRTGEYSPLADLFKTDPLVIIAADERDVVRVRSNVRKEDVQLYRLAVSPERARALLLEYVADANALAETPQFYNSIATNCTTTIIKMMRVVGASMPFDWRFIVNGYLPDYAYARGALDTNTRLAELKSLAHIDKRANEAANSSDFSKAIRMGVPSPAPRTP